MKNKNIIETLKEKYNLAPDSYLTENVWAKKFTDTDFTEGSLEMMKLTDMWKSHIIEFWYGFSLYDRMPVVFFYTLQEFLEWVEENNPEFGICQIKGKFGGVRIYLDNINEETKRYCHELENLLSDKHLIY